MLLVAVEERRSRAEGAVQRDQPGVQDAVRENLARNQGVDQFLVAGAAGLGRERVGVLVNLGEGIPGQHRDHPMPCFAQAGQHRLADRLAAVECQPRARLCGELQDALLHPAGLAKPVADVGQAQRSWVIALRAAGARTGLDPVARMLKRVGRQRHPLPALAPQAFDVEVDTDCPKATHHGAQVSMVGRLVFRVAHRRQHALRWCARVLAHEGTEHVARADLEKDPVVGLEQGIDAVGEQDCVAQVLDPVLGVARARRVEPQTGSVRDDRQARLVQHDALQVSAKARQDLVEQAGMPGNIDPHTLRVDALACQPGHQGLQRRDPSRSDRQLRAVGRGQVEFVAQQRQQLAGRHRHADHAAGRCLLDQLAAQQQQAERIFEREHAGDAGRRVLAHAVADQRGRLDAVRLPQSRQCDFDEEGQRQLRRRLGQQLGLLRGGVAGGQQDRRQIGAEARLEHRQPLVDVLAKDGLAVVQAAPHAHVLRAAAGKHEHHGRLVEFPGMGEDAPGVAVLEQRDGFSAVGTGQHPALIEAMAPHAQRVGDVGESLLRVAPQPVGQALAGCVQRLAAARRQDQQLRRVVGLAARHGWWFLQYDEGIGAADTE